MILKYWYWCLQIVPAGWGGMLRVGIPPCAEEQLLSQSWAVFSWKSDLSCVWLQFKIQLPGFWHLCIRQNIMIRLMLQNISTFEMGCKGEKWNEIKILGNSLREAEVKWLEKHVEVIMNCNNWKSFRNLKSLLRNIIKCGLWDFLLSRINRKGRGRVGNFVYTNSLKSLLMKNQ